MRSLWRQFADVWPRPTLFVIVLVLLACGLQLLVGGLHVDNLVRDSFYRVGSDQTPSSRVALVLIDDASLARVGRWPWSRTTMAELTRRIHQAGAGVIGLDILFSEPQTREADAELAAAFRDCGPIVLVSKISTAESGSRWIEPLPVLGQTASAVGHAQATLDSDGVCRRFPPRELALEGSRWAFSIELAKRADARSTAYFLARYGLPLVDSAQPVEQVNPILIPIRYRSVPSHAFVAISAADVLDGRGAELLRDKVALVGFGPSELSDRLVTPVRGELPSPGVEIHAHIVDSILSRRLVTELRTRYWFLLLGLVCVAVIVAILRWRTWTSLLGMAGGIVVTYLVSFWVFNWRGLSFPVFPLLSAFVLGPLIVHAAEFLGIERGLNARLRDLRANLRNRSGYSSMQSGVAWSGSTEGPVHWKLALLGELQATLGSLYQFEHTLIEATQDLIAVFDGSSNLVFGNSAFQRFSERLVPGAKPTWKRLEQLIHQGRPEGGKDEASQDGAFATESMLLEELWSVRVTKLPSTNLFGPGAWLLAMTSLKSRMERDRARSEALGFITHELRTPLTAIQGFSELLMSCPGAPAVAKAPEVIFRESRRMLALINSYLDVLRSDADASCLRWERVDLSAIVNEVCQILQPLADSQHIHLSRTSSGSVTLTADRALVTGAVLNLVSNAIKYSRHETEVRIRTEGIDDAVSLLVWNEGETIALADQAKVFDAYFRAQSVESRKPGWGLGLAFVKRIAEKHGGSVGVSSQADKGTTFRLLLPSRLASAAGGSI